MQMTVEKQLELLRSNSQYPSLNIKRMNDPRGFWEGRATTIEHLPFQMTGDTYVMRKVGTDNTCMKPAA